MGKKIKILFFISNFGSGGRGRRSLELLTYLKNTGKYELMVVLNHNKIHYEYFYKLDIPYITLENSSKRSHPSILYRFFIVCKSYKPDILHVWGRKQVFYSIITSLILRIPLVNSQIAAAPPKLKRNIFYLVTKLNLFFSTVVLSNSKAGLDAYNVKGNKYRVIYNGVNLNRFVNLTPHSEVKKQYGITTPFCVIMVANISIKKGVDTFIRLARIILEKRRDVMFLLVGSTLSKPLFTKVTELAAGDSNIKLTGCVDNVEDLVNACDIGVLFSNKEVHGEGIPNAVVEYMALRKPVIANDAGGTKELVSHKKNGYLITNENLEEVADLLQCLLDDPVERERMGEEARKTIELSFSLGKMGQNFEHMYNEIVQ
jgi:glycosyltransferase involved in cell wall biosynthesis